MHNVQNDEGYLRRDGTLLQEYSKILNTKRFINNVNNFSSRALFQGLGAQLVLKKLRIIVKNVVTKLFQKICQHLLIRTST